MKEDLKQLGDELKFLLITSKAQLSDEEAPADAFVSESLKCAFCVTKSKAHKCERCWHYEEDVDTDPAHPGLCHRCVENIETKQGEERHFA